MTVRLGVVGTGWWARFAHLPAIAADPELELAGVCDGDPAELYGTASLDGVVIATPNASHYRLARSALEAGLHVLVEKPMATTAAQAWELVEAAGRAGLHLSVGYTAQYTPAAFRVRRAVQEEIGELVCVNGDFSSSMMELFATPTYGDPALAGGGQSHSQLTHLAGALTWATGQQVAEVFAYVDNRSLAVDVVNALTFRLSGGALGAVSSTGTVPAGLATRQRLRYYGSAGMVEHDLQYGTAVLHRLDGSQVRLAPDPSDLPWPRFAPVQAFGALIAGRGANHAPGAAAAAAVALIEAAHLSAATRLPVPCSIKPV